MSLMSDLGTKIGTELKKKFDINTGNAQISFINNGNTTFFQTADQIGHPTVLIQKTDDAKTYNSALMVAADADAGNLDDGSADIAIDIRGTSTASTTIIDYNDITHRNAFITGGGTIWAKRYVNAEMGLQEAGVDISTKYAGITHTHSEYLPLTGGTVSGMSTFNSTVNFNQDINFNSVGNGIYCKRDTTRRASLIFVDETDTPEWYQYHEANGSLNWQRSSGTGTFQVNGNEVLTTAYVMPVIKCLDTATSQDAQTAHTVNWETTEFNNDTSVFAKPSASEIQVLKAGLYRVTYNVRYSNTGANRVSTYAVVKINGTNDNQSYTKAYSRGISYGSEVTNFCQVIYSLNANDKLQVQVGLQQADQTTAVPKVADSGFFQVEKVG